MILACQAAKKYAPKKILFASFAIDRRLTFVNGESVEECVKKMEKLDNPPDGYGTNCSELEYSIKVLKNIAEITPKPLIFYPNDLLERKADHRPSEGSKATLKSTSVEDYTKCFS